MINILDLFVIILYIALIVLVISLTVFILKGIQTLNKVDKLVDDMTVKSSKLNGVFNFIDGTTDALANVSDTIVNFVADAITKIFRKKDKNE